MIRLDAPRGVRFCDGLTRRDFLHVGAIAPLGLTLAGYHQARAEQQAKDDTATIAAFLGSAEVRDRRMINSSNGKG